jgi:hypothetical protein
MIDPKAPNKILLGKGLPASPGATTGEVVFTPEEAEAMVKVRKRGGGFGVCGLFYLQRTGRDVIWRMPSCVCYDDANHTAPPVHTQHTRVHACRPTPSATSSSSGACIK